MRPMLVLTLLSLLVTSLGGCVQRADLYVADVASVVRGEKTLEEVAQEIVAREFNPHATLEIKRVLVKPVMLGYEGEVVEADPGYAFFHARVRFVNNGTMDLSVSTWQFSSIDEAGSETNAEIPMAHQDFDAERVRKGGAREGWVVFEMEEDARLTGIVWTGLLTDARGEFNGTLERPN